MGGTIVTIRCVFFDAAGTIIHAEPSVQAMYARALRGRGVEVDPGRVGERFFSAWDRMREEAHGRPPYGTTAEGARQWWREVVRRTYEPWEDEVEVDGIFEELWEYFARPEAWRVYGDVRPCLDALDGRGVRLGLISNWDVRLPRVLRGLGLWERFEVRVISFEVGAEKPDGRIFREALRRAHLEPEQALHVGDSREGDLLGARRAGMEALWLRRGGGAGGEEGAIETLGEVEGEIRMRNEEGTEKSE
jgi:putative hydrolase of the HAD superfamily